MLKTRVIPVLLLKNKGLVKTVKFKNPRYIGDPINAVKIFNEKEVDELIFLDVEATVSDKTPDFNILAKIASECFMPLCYGGGVKDVDTFGKLLKLGMEKVALNTQAVLIPKVVAQAANKYGSQAVVVSVDVKKDFWGNYRLFIKNGSVNTGQDPTNFAINMVKLGAGELLINNIDLDGTMQGYDLKLLGRITCKVNVPVIACGGAGNLIHFKEAVKQSRVAAVAAGSLFVYHGRNRGILINYPSQAQLSRVL